MENEMETVVLRERYYSSAPVSYDNYRLFCVAEDDRLKNVRRIIQSRGRDRMIFKPQQEDGYHASGFISAGDCKYIKTTWIKGAAADDHADRGYDQPAVRTVFGPGTGHQPFYRGEDTGIAGAVHGGRRSAGFLCRRGRFGE